jgi:hypothetical protein
MLDDGECPKAIVLEFKKPIIIIEWSGPLQKRHGLELQGHRVYSEYQVGLSLSRGGVGLCFHPGIVT